MIEITRGIHDVTREVALAEWHVDETAKQIIVALSVGPDVEFASWAARSLRDWVNDAEAT